MNIYCILVKESKEEGGEEEEEKKSEKNKEEKRVRGTETRPLRRSEMMF